MSIACVPIWHIQCAHSVSNIFVCIVSFRGRSLSFISLYAYFKNRINNTHWSCLFSFNSFSKTTPYKKKRGFHNSYIYSAQIYLYRRHVRPCIWYTPLQFSATTTLISPSRVFSQGFSIIINSLFSASVFSNKIICMHVCSEEEIGFTKRGRSLIIILVHDPACPAGIMGQINNGWNPYLHIGTVLVFYKHEKRV